MSTAYPKARKLSSFVKCGRCRQDRQKCERPEGSRKCLRCAKYKHDCDSGRASNRAQRSQKLSSRQRASPGERTTAASRTAQHELLAVDSYESSIEGTLNLKVEEVSSSRTSRSASSEQSTSWSIPSTQDGLASICLDTDHRYEDCRDSAYSPQSDTSSNRSPSFTEHDAGYSLELVGRTRAKHLQGAFKNSGDSKDIGSASNSSQTTNSAVVCSDRPFVDIQTLSSLTTVRPSRRYSPTPFEERLNTRLDRLWGNYKTFASASSKGLGVTLLFGRTLSELFRQSRQMAENGDDLVADVRYACGAADACMNKKLPDNIRAQYLEAYHRYDLRANLKYHRAVHDFAKKIAKGESLDVLPLYIATFLYYAAGACMRGSDDLLKATFAFRYFNQFTAWFPIRIKILPTCDGNWSADMLLANNNQDPGMRINTLMFALGRARLEFDRRDGLC